MILNGGSLLTEFAVPASVLLSICGLQLQTNRIVLHWDTHISQKYAHNAMVWSHSFDLWTHDHDLKIYTEVDSLPGHPNFLDLESDIFYVEPL